MQFGWQTVSDETYYFQQDGTAATGSVTIQGSEYNFQKEGVLLHGWSNDGKSYYDEKGNKTSTNSSTNFHNIFRNKHFNKL